MLEICIDEPGSLIAAIAGGANRIEVCGALALGGLTPSAALVGAALSAGRARGVAIHAIIRPRGGDFTYDARELVQAIAEAQAMLALGVDGLVFGATRAGRLDSPALGRWVAAVRVERAQAVSLTLHRAIDSLADPVTAVGEAAALGFDRVLTSGGARAAPDGAATIARMVAAGGDRVTVMAGAGITAATLPALLQATGVREIHASASREVAVTDPRVTDLGFADPPRRVTDQAAVGALRDILDRYGVSGR